MPISLEVLYSYDKKCSIYNYIYISIHIRVCEKFAAKLCGIERVSRKDFECTNKVASLPRHIRVAITSQKRDTLERTQKIWSEEISSIFFSLPVLILVFVVVVVVLQVPEDLLQVPGHEVGLLGAAIVSLDVLKQP